MGLSSLKIRWEDVEVAPGESFPVRGLSLPDVTRLVRNHGGALSQLVEAFASGQMGAALEDIGSLASKLMDQAPAAASEAIALAASRGNPTLEEIEIAATLPIGVQLDAIEKIGRLTFGTEGAAKKALEMFVKVARGMSSTLKSVRT